MDCAVQPRTARVPAKARHQPGAQDGVFAFGTPYHEITGRCTRSPVSDSRLKSSCISWDSRARPGSAGSRRRLFHELARNGPSGGRRTGGDSRTTRLTRGSACPRSRGAPGGRGGGRSAVPDGEPRAGLERPGGLRWSDRPGPGLLPDVHGPGYRQGAAVAQELPGPRQRSRATRSRRSRRRRVRPTRDRVTPPGSGRSYYAIQGLGLRPGRSTTVAILHDRAGPPRTAGRRSSTGRPATY